MEKPTSIAIKDRGIELRPLDTKGSHEELVSALKDIDILISAVGPREQPEQMPLTTAAKEAGVKLLVPCAFMSAMPVGVHILRDQKEEVYNHIKRLHMPYVIIDVGWCKFPLGITPTETSAYNSHLNVGYQLAFPALPSGKIDYAVGIPSQTIPADGNVPSALTDLRDIGRYVTAVIKDERALNKQVLVYNEMWTQNQVYDLMEKISGEILPRTYDNLETIEKRINEGFTKLKDNPTDYVAGVQLVGSQYQRSWGVKGENTSEYAKYLGYVTSKELYPDLTFTKFEDYIKDVVDGKAKGVYEEMKRIHGDALKKIQQDLQ